MKFCSTDFENARKNGGFLGLHSTKSAPEYVIKENLVKILRYLTVTGKTNIR